MPTMQVRRCVRWWLPAALACVCSGCLFVRHTTHQVREKEALRPARFESAQTQSVFEAGVNDLKAHKNTSDPEVVAVPFVIWYSSVSELSDNAIYNDQISVCDTNGDNLITLDEAQAFRASTAEKVASLEKAKAGGSKNGSSNSSEGVETSLATRPAASSPPPGLIHY